MINNKIYPVRRGTLLIIHRHEYHRMVSDNKEKQLFKSGIILSSSVFNDYGSLKQYALKTLFKCGKDSRHVFHFEKSEAVEIEIIVKKFYKDYTEKNNTWKESIVAGLIRLCILVQNHIEKSKGSLSQVHDVVIHGCLDYIDRNISSDLSLHKLSKVTGLAPNYLSAKFSSTTGINVKNYIIEKRISEAKKRLELNPEIKIIAISNEVGFKDLSNFNYTFKKLTGFTPSNYRKISQK